MEWLISFLKGEGLPSYAYVILLIIFWFNFDGNFKDLSENVKLNTAAINTIKTDIAVIKNDISHTCKRNIEN